MSEDSYSGLGNIPSLSHNLLMIAQDGIPQRTAMRIPEMYSQPGPTISFEFFPPKNDEAEEALFRDIVPGLKRLRPGFISVTYHVGGGSRERTFRIVDKLAQAIRH